jgi:hypothetical protein
MIPKCIFLTAYFFEHLNNSLMALTPSSVMVEIAPRRAQATPSFFFPILADARRLQS